MTNTADTRAQGIMKEGAAGVALGVVQQEDLTGSTFSAELDGEESAVSALTQANALAGESGDYEKAIAQYGVAARVVLERLSRTNNAVDKNILAANWLTRQVFWDMLRERFNFSEGQPTDSPETYRNALVVAKTVTGSLVVVGMGAQYLQDNWPGSMSGAETTSGSFEETAATTMDTESEPEDAGIFAYLKIPERVSGASNRSLDKGYHHAQVRSGKRVDVSAKAFTALSAVPTQGEQVCIIAEDAQGVLMKKPVITSQLADVMYLTNPQDQQYILHLIQAGLDKIEEFIEETAATQETELTAVGADTRRRV